MVYNQQMPMQPMQTYNPGIMQPLPYQDRMAQLQQYNQGLQQQFPSLQPTQNVTQQMPSASLNGKVIQIPENITANDVPMNGEVALFPKQDMSEIYAKAWQSDGTIKTVVYKPVEPILDAQASNSTPTQENTLYEAVNSTLACISEKVDTLTSRFDEYIGKPKTNAKAKREVEANE